MNHSATPVRLAPSMERSNHREGWGTEAVQGYDSLGRIVFSKTPHVFAFFRYRDLGKSVFQLLGRPLMTFPQWRMCQLLPPAPATRSQHEYEAYLRYVENHKLANSRAPVATVKAPKPVET